MALFRDSFNACVDECKTHKDYALTVQVQADCTSPRQLGLQTMAIHSARLYVSNIFPDILLFLLTTSGKTQGAAQPAAIVNSIIL
uniref:Uncharacterized protein n=1 Tax=Echinococcus granulosus TaxID=6210 RepID=A0A068WDW9_ECHGR|nr:hypothetical protein EgrG_000825300 [Echinococcus granulosus]